MLTIQNASLNYDGLDLLVYPAYSSDPSQVILPSQDVINVDSVDVYDAAYASGGNLLTSAAPGQTVYVRATISDPFGSFDITGADSTLTDSEGTIQVTTAAMTEANDSGAATKVFEYAYTIPPLGPTGNWSIEVTATEGTEVGGVTHSAFGSLPVVALPNLTVVKSASGPTAKPGDVITYTVQVVNTGAGMATNVVLTDHLSPYTAWSLDSYGAGQPFQLIQGSPASGLSLGVPEYSDNDGTDWNYAPISGAGAAPAGYDGNVTNWRIPMAGTMNADSATFTLRYRVQVK
jgi:uncharacterized repeat protein (TIGR01451 family)